MISMKGTMGPPDMPNIDVCLKSISKLNYDTFNTTIPQRGICIYGSSLFLAITKTKTSLKRSWLMGGFTQVIRISCSSVFHERQIFSSSLKRMFFGIKHEVKGKNVFPIG
jgi:hypothetical protein